MRSFLGNAIMEKENKKKGQVMNIINKLSVVISVYNEEAVLDKMYQAVVPVVESLPCEYELLFVNDGSSGYIRPSGNGVRKGKSHSFFPKLWT